MKILKNLNLNNPLHALIAFGGACLISLIFVGSILCLTFLSMRFL